MASPGAVSVERLERGILSVRNHRVMLDADLAALYGVETRALVQAVNRNIERFPGDFMLRLTAAEAKALRSQFVISKLGRGGSRYLPYAFTEQGVAMLSTVLRSPRAVHRDHAHVRAPEADAGRERRAREAARRARGEARRQVSGRLRRDPRPHGAAGAGEAADRVRPLE
jgi:hypothetical protein